MTSASTEEVFNTTSTLDSDTKISKPSTTEKVRQVMKMKTKKDRIRMAVAIIGFLAVIAIIITGAVLGAKAKKKDDEVDPTEPPTSSFRLPDTLKPLAYQVKLQPFINGNFTIDGYVFLEMQVVKPTSVITLHIVDIITHNDTVKVTSRPSPEGPEREIVVSKQEYDPEREFYIATLEEELEVNHLIDISMSFTGLLNDQLKGFYRSSYLSSEGDTRWLAVSFFAPTHARRAFPCMDEPAMKARFGVSLAREDHMSALANMPLMISQPIEGQEGWVWDHFETTVPMSTYLVAFVISDFANLTDGNFSVWSREDLINQADRSLEVGPPILEYYEDYFSIEYPLPKMDMVAVPDFAAGAMENWGLITYREEDMLLPEGSSAAGHQRVVIVVAHELAHQWFGNLVTPSWWTDIWLNEGFASYLENVGTHQMEPTWHMLDQMVLTMQDVMVADGLPSTHPVSQPVEHPDEIGQIFDAISYDKGMSVIRMMNHFLTEDTFRKGLTNYLNHFAYDSATQDDLWEFLTAAAKEDGRLPQDASVKDIMDTWTLQGGYPVVGVTRSEDGTVTLTQQRFLLAGNSSDDQGSSWWVPISYTSANAPNFTYTFPDLWIPAGTSSYAMTPKIPKEHWVILNIQGTGYFRVNYEVADWGLISDQLMTGHTVIEVVTRAQLLDDALSLARGGYLTYDVPLDLVNYLEKEVEYVPWSSAMDGFSYLEQMLTRTAAYGDLRRYLLSLLEPLYFSVGFEDSPDDPHLDQYKRSLAVSWACKMGHEECESNAVNLFNAWMANATEVSANTKSTVYCMGVASGGQEAWEGVWERYLDTEVASEQTHLLRALGCSNELWLLARYLDMAFTEGSGIRKQDIALVFGSVADNDISRTMAWNFLRDQWERIVTYYDSFSSVGRLITSATKEFNTPIEKFELETFYKEHEDSLSTATRAVQIALENTDVNIAWMENNYEEIKKWLGDNAGV
ncbi:aminopeptidase N-like isoform X1 [Eriocheir sinensis]|uniref:aminopeptidase N-like isoform X1 n=1 Tax=Eriocheir sinensis TaxID=95602 RepID=UPI0021C8A0A9|nr:aminopeptidase N-like isoform X1 [Eriocheir sinensis]